MFLEAVKVDSQCDSGGGMRLADHYRLPQPLQELEPTLDISGRVADLIPLFSHERSVDPQHLTAAAIAAAKHRNIDFSSGNPVVTLTVIDGKAAGVRTNTSRSLSWQAWSVNWPPGAWAAPLIAPLCTSVRPTRPVKGQMLCIVTPQKELVRHVVRTPDVYLIPRSDGRMLIGATQEEAGFDKQMCPIPSRDCARPLWRWSLGSPRRERWKPGQDCVPEHPTPCRFWARLRRPVTLLPPAIFAMAFCWRQSQRESWRS